MLRLFYSSGSEISKTFNNVPSKSIGGVVTETPVSKGLGKLFGTVAMSDLANGSEDFRCVFLKNIDDSREITDLTLYVDLIEDNLAEGFDPSILTPNEGDQYIVPVGAIGEWLGYDGKIATWESGVWTFELNYFAKFKFSKEDASNFVSDDETIESGKVQVLNDIYQPPFGVDFISADRAPNLISLGNINAGSQIALWINRIIAKYVFQLIDFDVVGLDVNEGGIVLEEGQTINFIFDYIQKTSYSFVLPGTEYRDNINVQQNITVPLRTNLTGEEGYTNLRCNVRFIRNNIETNQGLSMSADFLTITYNNVQNSGYIGPELGFPVGINFDEDIDMRITFTSSAVYDVILELVDLTNDSNIVETKTIRFIIS